MPETVSPFIYFTDTAGGSLDNGYVYIGTVGLDAQTNPITTFYDKDLLIPAVQPLRTSAGYIMYQGAPTAIYTAATAYSIKVKDKNGALVYEKRYNYTPVLQSDFADFVNDIADDSGSSLVGFVQSGSGAVSQTVQNKLRNASFSVEDFGATGDGVTDDTDALQKTLDAANGRVSDVLLTSGTYRYSRYLNVPVGVSIRGPRDAILMPVDQQVTNLTAPIGSGTGQKVISVDDTSAFIPGRNAIIISTTAHTVSPNDPFEHRGRVVEARSVASGPGTVTLAAGPNITSHVAGDKLCLATPGLICMGNNVLDGFTVDGNSATHTYAHWITSTPVVGEGNNVDLRGLLIQNTPSDAVLYGGPSGGEITSLNANGVIMSNIGGNGFHMGNCRGIRIIGCEGYLGNVRWNLPVEQGGGNSVRQGHQDGFVTLSNDVADTKVVGCVGDNWICGVGAIGTTVAITVQENDDVVVTGNSFVDCNRPLEAIQTAKRIIFSNNRCVSQFPYNTGTHRWLNQQIYVFGDSTDGFAQDVNISGNVVKNGGISMNQVRNASVCGNNIDNRQLNATATSLLAASYGIQLYNFTGFSVTGNIVQGGHACLWLQNSFALANALCRDTVISDNIFQNAYSRCVSGTLGSTGLMEVDFFNNVVRGRLADTLENGTTPLTFDTAGGWRAVTIIASMRVENNRIDHDITGGQTYAIADAATGLARRNNMVNGVREVVGGPAAVTVGASPFTYTASTQRESLYIRGGTVSDIKIGAVSVFTATEKTVALEPGQQCVITYTVLPTVIKNVA